MKTLFHEVCVVRDPNFHIPRQAAQWEIPILQEIYGEGQVEVGKEYEFNFAKYDGVESEHARLSAIYGKEEDSKIPFVEVVYGRGPAGLKALGKAIEQARVNERKKAEAA